MKSVENFFFFFRSSDARRQMKMYSACTRRRRRVWREFRAYTAPFTFSTHTHTHQNLIPYIRAHAALVFLTPRDVAVVETQSFPFYSSNSTFQQRLAAQQSNPPQDRRRARAAGACVCVSHGQKIYWKLLWRKWDISPLIRRLCTIYARDIYAFFCVHTLAQSAIRFTLPRYLCDARKCEWARKRKKKTHTFNLKY